MYHVPVLLQESVDGLNIDPHGVYLDLTFGGGGHSREILRRLDDGCLIGFDQDRDAEKNVPSDERFVFVNHNFRYLRHFLRYCGYEKADGILADLGVSWHEFDNVERGFAFRFDAKLDMRMNQREGLTAAEVVNTYEEDRLARIFRDYGEVENARRVAGVIVAARMKRPICRSGELLEVIAPCVPKQKEKKYLAQVFQALRIEVNRELEALEDMKTGNFEGKAQVDFYGKVEQPFLVVNRKVIVPSEEEVERNPRARSAKLRIAEKK